jgi:hypothetical protein
VSIFPFPQQSIRGPSDLCSFFYADERDDAGNIKGMSLDGPAHGEFYAQLANHDEDVPWRATFVKGKGYIQFE